MADWNANLPQDFLERLRQVRNRRARIVIDHILKHGYITTQELKDLYGYNHPPRAAKDVRDEGIPLETFSIKSSDGRTIAAYRFGNPEHIVRGRFGGRVAFSRKFKETLYTLSQGQCAICNARLSMRELQIDHRIPYEIAGDVDFSATDTHAYMLICGSCNRSKSWSCEHCPNWITKQSAICEQCYWANPTEYEHIATRLVRRADLIWEGDEVEVFNQIKASALAESLTISQYIKQLLRKFISRTMSLFISGC